MSRSDERSGMHLLFIAPSAPPKNSPEAIQVGRILTCLDEKIRVTLVTTPVVADWQWNDHSLELPSRVQSIVPALPFHPLSQRILANRRLSRVHLPDSEFWIAWFADYVVRKLSDVPDVIYSRSCPFSAAALALKLKHRLRCPWMMHLSDPWAGNPYHVLSEAKQRAQASLEEACFHEADAISLTTPGQAAFYKARYPARAEAVFVAPNMMPVGRRGSTRDSGPRAPLDTAGAEINLVHLGALYGARNPSVLVNALGDVRTALSMQAERLRVHFVGNASAEIAELIDRTPECRRYPPVSFDMTAEIIDRADLLLSIETAGRSELHDHFLPTKIVDYLASDKSILAITPPRSITADYCRRGYGWAFAPDDVAGLAAFLMQLLQSGSTPNLKKRPPPPAELEAATVVQTIETQLYALLEANVSSRGRARAG